MNKDQRAKAEMKITQRVYPMAIKGKERLAEELRVPWPKGPSATHTTLQRARSKQNEKNEKSGSKL